MSHGPTKIKTKGVCIYCNKAVLNLTDEHIIPLSLGGQHVIQKASCLDCADITKKFEQDVARGLWGDARISFDAPSRRKKERPSHITLSGRVPSDMPLKVSYSEYPAPMIFYKIPQAGILQGFAHDQDLSPMWKLVYIADDYKIKKFETNYPGRLTAEFRHVPESFGRLIAKIGYGQVLCSLDPSDFNPICLPYILGTEKNLSYVVGGREAIAEMIPGIGYSMDSHFFGTSDRGVLVAEVRLFANNGTPNEIECNNGMNEHIFYPNIKKPHWVYVPDGRKMELHDLHVKMYIKKSYYFGYINNLESAKYLQFYEQDRRHVIFDPNDLSNYRETLVSFSRAEETPQIENTLFINVKLVHNPDAEMKFAEQPPGADGS